MVILDLCPGGQICFDESDIWTRRTISPLKIFVDKISPQKVLEWRNKTFFIWPSVYNNIDNVLFHYFDLMFYRRKRETKKLNYRNDLGKSLWRWKRWIRMQTCGKNNPSNWLISWKILIGEFSVGNFVILVVVYCWYWCRLSVSYTISALMKTLERCKRKSQLRLRKLETEMMTMMDKHAAQVSYID